MSGYRLYIDSVRTEHVVKAKRPAPALVALVEAAGLTLATQDGRYGKTVCGRSVSALTEPWGRVDGPEARTTRLA